MANGAAKILRRVLAISFFEMDWIQIQVHMMFQGDIHDPGVVCRVEELNSQVFLMLNL
jgi:hypothetical protein